jgi:hypothetical protein
MNSNATSAAQWQSSIEQSKLMAMSMPAIAWRVASQ